MFSYLNRKYFTYIDLDGAVHCWGAFRPGQLYRELDHLNRLWPDPRSAAEEMLGELPVGQVSTNLGSGPAYRDLWESADA